MKLTGNYNLKKPDATDVINIQDLNDNVEKLDEELKKLTVKTDDVAFTTATTRTNIVSGDTLKVMLGKIGKWFGDLGLLAFKNKVGVGDLESELIVHNLKTADTGKVLGADQGVELQEQLKQVNDNLASKILKYTDVPPDSDLREYFKTHADTDQIYRVLPNTNINCAISPGDFSFYENKDTHIIATDSGKCDLYYAPFINKQLSDWRKLNNDLTRYSKRENNAFEKDETILAWALTCLQNSTRFIGTPIYPSDMPTELASKECFVEIKLDHHGGRKMVYLSQYIGNACYCRSIFGDHWMENDWNKCY